MADGGVNDRWAEEADRIVRRQWMRPSDWAAECGSGVADERQAERAGTSAEHVLGGSMHEGRSSWAGLPMATY